MPQPSAYLLPQNPYPRKDSPPKPDKVDIKILNGGEVVIPQPDFTSMYFTKLTTPTWFGKTQNDYRLLFRNPTDSQDLTVESNKLSPKKGDIFVLVFREQNNIYQVELEYLKTSIYNRDKLEYVFNVVSEPIVSVYNNQASPPQLSVGSSLLLEQGYLYKKD